MEGKEFNLEIGLDQTLGLNGKSAYQIWLEAGNSGTEEDFLNSLRGPTGEKGEVGAPGPQGLSGPQGVPGKSVYQEWLDAGNIGNTSDFIASLKGDRGNDGTPGVAGEKGADGAPGKSAYQIWLEAGNSGTEEDFLNSLKVEIVDNLETNDVEKALSANQGRILKARLAALCSQDKTASIESSAWQEQGGVFVAEIQDADIKENSKISVMPSDVSDYDVFASCSLFAGTSSAGKFVLKAKKKPGSVINIHYTISI